MPTAGPRPPSATTSLHRPLADTWRVLARELSAFSVVGLSAFALDVALFQLLYAELGVGAVTSKLLSTLVATTAAFLGHRYWSFAHRGQTGLRQGYLRFAVINGATLCLGLGIVATARYGLQLESPLALQIANVGSIAIGTAFRWLAYRRWVFPELPSPATSPGAPRS
jgi:putative flippase GtrA